jgi:hypothetical protein
MKPDIIRTYYERHEERRIVRAWSLGCADGAVSLQLTIYHGRPQDACAEVGIHRFCQDGELNDMDQYPSRCDYSPTGHCHPDGSGLAGVRFIEEYGLAPSSDNVWSWLRSWLEDRFHVATIERGDE